MARRVADEDLGRRRRVLLRAERRFAASPQVVTHLFLERLWRGGAGARPRPVIEAAGGPDGLGCTRRIGSGRFVVRERITSTEPPGHLAYRVLPGSPLFPTDDHEGVIDALPDPSGGTLLRWRIEFTPQRRGLRAMAQLVMLWYLHALSVAVRQSRNA